ncbi:hypothetical protein V8C35DRAFT_146603 [Trichoderma chlorosporum]
MSLSRPLRYYAPLLAYNSQEPSESEYLCRVCNNFRYCEDFERIHVLEGRRTPRTRIHGDADSYTINLFTNHLLRDGKDDDEEDFKYGKDKVVDDADRLHDCPYCRLIFDVLNLFFKDEALNWREDALEDPTLFVQVKVRPGQPLLLNCEGAFIVYHDFTLVRADIEVIALDRGSLTNSDFPCAELASVQDDDAQKHRGGEGFFRFWFRGCSGYKDAMDQCYVTPLRLLHIDWDNDEVVLWESIYHPPRVPPIDKPIEYATLSHAWLNSDPGVPKLLWSNIEEWQQGRTISSLPAAIKDAIRVTHLSGVHFLFIDSLCLMQDSQEELRIQMPLVPVYFRDSILTIAAASALTPDDSFLHPPEKDWITKEVEFVAPSGAGATLTLRRKFSRPETPLDTLDKGSHIVNVAPGSFRRTGPLYGRHWCVRETLLGTRVIHFTSGGIMCQCRRHNCTREGVMKYNRSEWYRGMPERYGARKAAMLWLHAVEFHTACEELRGEDRLSLLSGLASMSDMGIEDRYIAGLWWNSMTMGLLWEVNMRPSQNNTTKIALPFSKQKAPSFSWASVDTPVVWRDNHWKSRPEARMVGCGSLTTYGDDPCGGVDGAWIRMEGYMFKCEVSQTLGGSGGDRWQFAYFTGKDGAKTKAYPFLGDGALVTVRAKGAMERLRERRRASKTRRRRLREKDPLGEPACGPHLPRAYLTRNHGEFRKKRMLGHKTIRGTAHVLCIRQRGHMDEKRGGDVFDRWDGLVLTKSMRYRGAYERIGCIRDLPSTLIDFDDRYYTVTIV